MKKFLLNLGLVCLACSLISTAQDLKLEEIMQGYDWVGNSPQDVRWNAYGQSIYFKWNPQNADDDSLFEVLLATGQPKQVSLERRKTLPLETPVLNRKKDKAVYTLHGDLFLMDLVSGETKQITNTLNPATDASFSYDGNKILFTQNDNLFSWHITNGIITQLTQFKAGSGTTEVSSSASDQWLEEDQLRWFQVLREQARKDSIQEVRTKALKPYRPLEIYVGKKRISEIKLSPDEQFVTYRLTSINNTPGTEVMDYVTKSGYAKSLGARPKVGNSSSEYEFVIYQIAKDTIYQVQLDKLPGIHDVFNFNEGTVASDSAVVRKVLVQGPYWSDDGRSALVQVRSLDNKDRWICQLDMSTGALIMLDRQTDQAWINGPGIGYLFSTPAMGWLADNQTVWFQSEITGYSHLYTLDIRTGERKALTSGDFEIYDPMLSRNKSKWYFSSNETHPGERHFYQMSLSGGKRTRITHLEGRSDVFISPDEKHLAILNSQAHQPWELYISENRPKNTPKRITTSQAKAFISYPWRTPEYITFPARDGANVPARLYKPDPDRANGAAVIFVHGAGYLQNAHKWWSSYYREYMFHNFLADHGYTILDIDYRGSAGYGRDWRTAIYQFMGGKDLSDQVDGAGYLIRNHQIDPKRLGIYGGSYGGFITLMAMFTEPDVFAAGAALRSVTDWAHYNHSYTSNILNQPLDDSVAYIKSSPIYHAEGLKGALLMLHGMVDRNVQYQDVVRLAQRLIELKKENWELAVYPMEGHGFVEASSWYDEYRRIFQLFEKHLIQP